MNICFLNWMIAFYNKFVKDLVQVLQLLLKIKVHFIIGCQIIHVQVCFLNLPLACGVFLLLLPLRQWAPGRCSRYTCISLCLFVSLPLPAPTSHLCLVRRHVNKYPSKWGRASASLLEWGLASSCWWQLLHYWCSGCTASVLLSAGSPHCKHLSSTALRGGNFQTAPRQIMKFTFFISLGHFCILGSIWVAEALKKQVNYRVLAYLNYKSSKEMLIDSLWSQL